MKKIFYCTLIFLFFIFCFVAGFDECIAYNSNSDAEHKIDVLHVKLPNNELNERRLSAGFNDKKIFSVHLDSFDDILFVKSICQQELEMDYESEGIISDYLKLCDSAVLMNDKYDSVESDDYIIAKYKQSRKGTEDYTELALKYASLDRGFIDSLVSDLSVLTLSKEQLGFLCEYAVANNNYEPRCQSDSVLSSNDKSDIVREYLACVSKGCRQDIISALK